MAGESARERAKQARDKAERLQRVAQSWEQGADGEQATARVLGELPPGWVVLHDLRWPGRRFANIDHLVIGPGGVFVVDSKNWTGRVTADDGVLRQNGRSREKAVAGCADASLAVAGLVPTYAEHVHPVLCFVRDDEVRGWSRDVMLCSTTTLNEMLQSRPVVLAPQGVAHLRATLASATGSATAPAPGGTRRRKPAPAVAAPPTRRKRRAEARRRKALREAVVGLAALLAFLMFGPLIAHKAGPMLSELFTSSITTSQDECAATRAKARPAGCPAPTPRAHKMKQAPKHQ